MWSLTSLALMVKMRIEKKIPASIANMVFLQHGAMQMWLEFWSFAISKFWNFGILETLDFGNFGNLGIFRIFFILEN